MIILGLDPGLATMGYGVVEKLKNDNTVAVDYGVVLTPKDESLPVRLAMLEEGINKILDKYKPDEIAVEELFFSKNITTGIPVAHARGVMLLTCIKYCGKLYEYTWRMQGVLCCLLALNIAASFTNTRPTKSSSRSLVTAKRIKSKCSTS